MVALLVGLVLVMWAVISAAAFQMVNDGEVTVLAALFTLLAVILTVVAALRRVLSESPATVPFCLAAASFALASWQWGYSYSPGRLAIVSAFAAVAAVTLLRARSK